MTAKKKIEKKNTPPLNEKNFSHDGQIVSDSESQIHIHINVYASNATVKFSSELYKQNNKNKLRETKKSKDKVYYL